MGQIQEFRKQQKITQKKASEIIGCHHKTIHDIERRLKEHLFIQYLKLLRSQGFDLNTFFDENIILKDHSSNTE